MKHLRSFFPLLILIAVGIALLASGQLDRFKPENLAHEQARLTELIGVYPLLAGLAQIGAMALSIATGIPGAIAIVLAGGMLFGVVWGTILSTMGLTLGGLILFLASRNAFGSAPHKKTPAIVEKLRTGYLAHPVSYTLFLRLVPLFPFGGITVALAWLRCPLWLFSLSTLFGGAIMIGFETALGAGLAKTIAEKGTVNIDTLTDPHVLLPMLALGLLALVPIAISKLKTTSPQKN